METYTVTLKTGEEIVVQTTSGKTHLIARRGDELNSSTLPAAQWAQLGPVACSREELTLLGSATSATGESTTGIFRSDISGSAWEPVVTIGQEVPGIQGERFEQLDHPVISSTAAGIPGNIAFLAVRSGAGGRKSLWVASKDGALVFVAEEGAAAAEWDENVWTRFKSIALPGGDCGPLLLAERRRSGLRKRGGKPGFGESRRTGGFACSSAKVRKSREIP
jgi:hypothetical protein